MKFKNTNIRLATLTDASAIVQLLDNAYRGELSKKGWTTEAHLISGNQRTNHQQIEALLQQKQCYFLKYVNDEKQLIGCVNLQIKNEGIYFGMFSVHPLQQGAGIGKELLLAAEEFAKAYNMQRIYMTVIDARADLIAWYERNGYTNTNITIPFEEDTISGKHLQKLSFTVLEKYV
jgi:N-acetylglutamate synthase-like GNAT family acetyltransferase